MNSHIPFKIFITVTLFSLNHINANRISDDQERRNQKFQNNLLNNDLEDIYSLLNNKSDNLNPILKENISELIMTQKDKVNLGNQLETMIEEIDADISNGNFTKINAITTAKISESFAIPKGMNQVGNRDKQEVTIHDVQRIKDPKIIKPTNEDKLLNKDKGGKKRKGSRKLKELEKEAKKPLLSTKPSQRNVDSDLDLLLPYLLRSKRRRGMVRWRGRSPFPTAYIGVAVENKKEKRNINGRNVKKGVNIYTTGLNMPTGYTQIMEGHQLNDERSRAIVRMLDPIAGGPFVEFKIRMENMYGMPCKQLCLTGTAGRQRYRRCARRLVRLSTHAKFSDPIAFYRTAEQAAQTQQRFGRDGLRRRIKPDYLMFRCE